jgi:hypothetical protein
MADARFQFGPSQCSNILPDPHTKGKCCWDTLVKQSCDAFIAKAHCREWKDGSIHKHVGCFVVADVPAPPAVDDKIAAIMAEAELCRKLIALTQEP